MAVYQRNKEAHLLDTDRNLYILDTGSRDLFIYLPSSSNVNEGFYFTSNIQTIFDRITYLKLYYYSILREIYRQFERHIGVEKS